MRKYLAVLCLLFFSTLLHAQSLTAEQQEVMMPIQQFFDGMKKADSTIVRAAVMVGAKLETVMEDKTGKVFVKMDKIDSFIKAIATPHAEIYDERISNVEIKIDGKMAVVWAPYSFYLGAKLSHCGVDAFQLVKTNDGWKIWGIIDTRRKEGCK
jgi:Putative lumazine-binding